MRRKITKHGSTTLSVSLPSKWAKRFNLKKGDEIEVTERGNELIISGSGKEIGRKTGFIELKDIKNFARRIIFRYYREGYDELKIKFSDPKFLVMIQRTLEESPGFEIVEQGKDYVRIKNVSVSIDEEFDSILNRMLLIIITMSNDILEGIKKKDNSLISNTISHEASMQKLSYFCERHLYTKGYREYSKTLFLYSDVRVLEEIGDVFRDLGAYLSNSEFPLTRFVYYAPKSKELVKTKTSIGERCIETFEDLNKILDFVHKHFRKFDDDSIIEFKNKILALQKKIFDNMPEYNLNEMIISHYLISTIYFIRHLSELA